jgi:hypothetical protein
VFLGCFCSIWPLFTLWRGGFRGRRINIGRVGHRLVRMVAEGSPPWI